MNMIMTLLFVLVLIFELTNAGDTESKLNETWIRIRELNENLTNIYRHVPRGMGEVFLNNIRLFNDELKKIIEFGKEDPKKTFHGIKDVLEKHPGPGWTDVDINETVLKQNFGWDDAGVKEMYDIRQDTFIYWNDVWCLQTNYPPRPEGHVSTYENWDD